jgi:hypothetical protein
MGVEDILKIASDTRKISLEDSQKKIDSLNGTTSSPEIEKNVVEDAKYTDDVKKRAGILAERIKKETEDESRKLGHENKESNSRIKEENTFSQDKKINQTQEAKKAEDFERIMKKKESSHLEFLEKDLLDCRKMYASIEYNDRSKLSKARKGLASNNNEESISTKDARDVYEKSLTRFKNAKIEELQEKALNGVDGKKLTEVEFKHELKELITRFSYLEATDLFAARGEAKAETLMGRDVVKKCWGLMEKTANAYNKLPLWSKIGLSLATVGAGLYGAVAVVGAKRVLGGVVAGVGSAKLIEALHQKGVKKGAEKDAEKIIEELGKIEGKYDQKGFEALSSILDEKISHVDEQLKKQKKVALVSKFVGITAGIFLGSGIASKAFGAASSKTFGAAADYYSEHVGHAKHAKDAVVSATHGAVAGPPAPEVIHAPAPVERVTISPPGADTHGHVRHDSFIRSLKNHLAHHPGVDPAEASHMAELTFSDAAKEYAQTHNMSYADAVKKLSNIQPGTSYDVTWDANGHPHMHINEGGVKFANMHEHAHNATPVKDVVKNVTTLTPTPGAPTGDTITSSSIFDYFSAQYGEALNVDTGNFGGLTAAQSADLKMYQEAMEAAKSNLWGAAANPESQGARLLNILKIFGNGSQAEWRRIAKLPVLSILEATPEQRQLSGALVGDKALRSMAGYAAIVQPKPGEAVGKWVARIMIEAKNGKIKL